MNPSPEIRHPLGELVTTTPYTPEQRVSRWYAGYKVAANGDYLDAQAQRITEIEAAKGRREKVQ